MEQPPDDATTDEYQSPRVESTPRFEAPPIRYRYLESSKHLFDESLDRR